MIDETHETMAHLSGEAKEEIKAKNERREEAIKGMRQVVKDEAKK